MSSTAQPTTALLKTPLHALHLELGARMVPFAGYDMPVQYPAGLMAEHKHTRTAASLFDVSHMGQLSITGADAAPALESLIPADVIGLPAGHQRYGLLLNSAGGIIDDLMMFNRGEDLFVIVNGACKVNDIAYMQEHIGKRCRIEYLESHALLALQGPQAVTAIQRLSPRPIELVFMTGGWYELDGIRCHITRSGYTGEDGFEISVPAAQAEQLARALLKQPEVMPAGLGARNSLRLEAGLCLYGNDMDSTTTPAEAALLWSIQKVRRTGGERAAGFPGAQHVLAQIDKTEPVTRKRVGLVALERVPVREGVVLQNEHGTPIGQVTSGLLAPTLDKPIAMGYLPPEMSSVGTKVTALVRGKNIPMEVAALPFMPPRYFRG
ncbi:Aminomethyltransferase [Saezia sanguinis]|uniref:aminomethyltransferase n=1 Tax=Saezia sanguinis TaxID=1965230 RepID=A0A433SF62_9BURK|nr:glycine cleavage system aminomethyltransferase GcvT [Saezia sanguinis]RUS67336.1 Aminomethyltransferase [Saezia sanguinis]